MINNSYSLVPNTNYINSNLEMVDSALVNKSSHCIVVKTDFLVRRLKF